MATTFILDIGNRDYTEWSLCAASINAQPPLISPAFANLFHHDVLDQQGNLVHSPYRHKSEICGVLLTSEKSYGRFKGGKLLYKCVPDDIHLPCFLIPYEEKEIGFSKVKKDKYITFIIKEWTDQNKHPIGTLTNTIGDVDEKEAYETYQLTCKEINPTLKQLNAGSLRALRENTLHPIPFSMAGTTFEDRRDYSIISIDPAGCTDIDDALGIKQQNGITILSIYISNVPMMLEYLKLWPLLTSRVATIYLPDKKLPMLPISLSENVCSLREKEPRLAFALDVHIKEKQIIDISCKSVIIKVEKNYAYDEHELLLREDYKSIFKTVCELNHTQTRKIKNLKYVDTITSSHEVVEYCMLLMNHECAKMLEERGTGIFRSATKRPFENTGTAETEAEDYEELPSGLKHILQNVSGEYCLYEKMKPHELIAGGLDCYTHITSPIRRLVDCINMLYLQEETFTWSAEAWAFLDKWETQGGIDSINAKTKAVRRIQNQMELFELYEKNNQQMYTGIVFAKTACNKKYKYKAYIRSLKLLTSVVTTKNIRDYSTVDFSVHLFMDETKMAKKVRLQLI